MCLNLYRIILDVNKFFPNINLLIKLSYPSSFINKESSSGILQAESIKNTFLRRPEYEITLEKDVNNCQPIRQITNKIPN